MFVASYSYVMTNSIGGDWVYVDANKEEVDMYITNHSKKGDVVITQDIVLLSLLLGKGIITMRYISA
ncbi:DUF188 domain-containing protein [Bacillus mesophilus]|uniref:DUF188 domain-containing protein n=1 Tax=Bacillus mesophilus TaxID=1808955 RepID=UPI0030844088